MALVATFIALGSSPRVRAFALLGMLLVLLQLFLGVANVVWQLPTMLREAHAANAVATFLAFVIAAALAVPASLRRGAPSPAANARLELGRTRPVSSTLSRVDGNVAALSTGWRGVLFDYYELTKPRIVLLLLVTTLAAMIMAAGGFPPLGLTVVTLLGGALAAGSGGAFNCAGTQCCTSSCVCPCRHCRRPERPSCRSNFGFGPGSRSRRRFQHQHLLASSSWCRPRRYHNRRRRPPS